MTARATTVLLLAAAVETLLVGLVPAAWRDLLSAGSAAAPAADRAGSVLSSGLLLAGAGAWTQWYLALVLSAAGASHGLLVPRAWRAAAVTALGLAVTAGTASAAGADRADTAPPGAGPVRLDGLVLPDRPVGGPPAATHAPAADVLTVRPGDTLWDLAASSLRPHATDAAVDRTWRAWYAANRGAVGPDPDLLLPGQRLVAPDPPRLDRNPR